MEELLFVALLGLEVLAALLLLGCSVFSFLHARRGEDIASVTFGVACFLLFLTHVVLLSVITRSGLPVLPSDHTLRYLPWFLGANYLLFGIGVFMSVFFNNRSYVVIVVPVLVVIEVLLLLGFLGKVFPNIPDFAAEGPWLWAVSGAVMLGCSFMYLMLYIQRHDSFRIRMSIALALLCAMMFLLINAPLYSVQWYAAQSLRLFSFAMLFYEVQTHY